MNMNWRALLGLAAKKTTASVPKELKAKIRYSVEPYHGSNPWMGGAWVDFSDGERDYMCEGGRNKEEATRNITAKVERYVDEYLQSGGKQSWTETK